MTDIQQPRELVIDAGNVDPEHHHPRSLHVSNIANVAYGYAKILLGRQHDVRVLCHDYGHVMSQPEWEDVLLDPADFQEEWNFHKNTANFGGYRRPEWYVSEPVVDPFGNLSKLRTTILKLLARRFPLAARRHLEPIYYKGMELRHRIIHRNTPVATIEDDLEQVVQRLVRASREFGPEWEVSEFALRRFAPYAGWMSHHSRDRDVVLANALSPIYSMIAGDRPYIGIEIGILREIPFGASPLSRVLWLAFKLANHVIITNPDNRKFAEEAGIERFTFCPHPVDDALFSPGEDSALRAELHERHGPGLLLLAPARQNWELKGNDKMFRAFARCVEGGMDATLLVPAWGQDIEQSKRLIESLGLGGRVHWLPPLPEQWLARYYRAVDIVLDQFNLGVFGLITPKAMSAGKPVLTSYDPAVNAWAFPEAPPLLPCSSEEEIQQALMRLAGDADLRARTGARSRDWVMAWHSRKVVGETLERTMAAAMEHYRQG